MSVLGKLTKTKLIIPYYHIISDEDILHVKHLYKYKTVQEFKEDIDFLLKNYSPIGLPDILDFIKSDRPLPHNVFLLTFDDGFREMYDIVAPILLKKGVCATFFVNSSFTDNKQLCYLNKASLLTEQIQKRWSLSLEKQISRVLRANEIGFNDVKQGILSIRYQQRGIIDEIAKHMNMDFSGYLLSHKPYLTSNQINNLVGSGFTIGAHSVDHPLYSSLSLNEQVHQTIQSVKFIRDTFKLNYGVFAFPHSDHNVSREFFTMLSDSGLVDLSFGTAGLVDDSISTNLQRFSLEKPIAQAERIVAFQHVRKLLKSVTRRAVVIRK